MSDLYGSSTTYNDEDGNEIVFHEEIGVDDDGQIGYNSGISINGIDLDY